MRSLYGFFLAIFGAGGALACATTAASAPASATDDSPDKDSPMRILPIGDSLTRGKLQHASYRYHLERALNDARIGFQFIGSQEGGGGGGDRTYDPQLYPGFSDQTHEGHGGWRSDQSLAALPDWWASYDETPDVAVIILGTNDADQDRIESTTQNLRDLISVLRQHQPNIGVVVGKIPPQWGPKAEQEPRVTSVNEGIATLSQLSTEQSPVLVIDLHTDFVPETMGMDDGVHPNSAGDAFIAERVMKGLLTVTVTVTDR